MENRKLKMGKAMRRLGSYPDNRTVSLIRREAIRFSLDAMGWLRSIEDKLFRRGKMSRPGQDIGAIMKEAGALLAEEKYEQARKILLVILGERDRIHHEAVIEWVLAGLESTWLFQDQFEEQISFFTEYVSRYPSDAAAYQARGAALWYLGRLDEAIRDYSRAADLNPMSILTLWTWTDSCRTWPEPRSNRGLGCCVAPP